MDNQEYNKGLYDPRFEHDACGVAFVADIANEANHNVVKLGIQALVNLRHRGAYGADPETGDGAGIMIQIPDKLFRDSVSFRLPPKGRYGSGICFLPADAAKAEAAKAKIAEITAEEGCEVLGWREVPVNLSLAGQSAQTAAPSFLQIFIAPSPSSPAADLQEIELDRLLFVIRKRIEHSEIKVYFPSLSCRTFVYKGMLASDQLEGFYGDLSNPLCESSLALVHSRFSTNTFPSWQLAHPYRVVAHNGEINTVNGNRNWMHAREALLASEYLPKGFERLLPILTEANSDSASFDETLELLHLFGRSLPHAVLMMIPEAWQHNDLIDDDLKAFFQFHSCIMEPWDGPAAVAFTDGTVIGAVLDRNGLRPARYWTTKDGLVVLASEVGVLDLPQDRILHKGRLQPGRMFLVDTKAKKIIRDDELKKELAAAHPYREWVRENLLSLDELPPRFMLTPQHAAVVNRQRLFGFTGEELRVIITPMAKSAAEPIGSMGSDTPIAVLSEKPKLLFDYFNQIFAQVTNPPLDAIREEMVTSLSNTIGPEENLLVPSPTSCRQITIKFPIIANDELAKLMYINENGETPGFKAFAIDGLYKVAEGGAGMANALEHIADEVLSAIKRGANIIILSDRNSNKEMAPIPSLLLTSAVHNHLIRERARTRAGLIIESGDAREVHHMALLVGYGAVAVNPYLAIESVEDMVRSGDISGITEREAVKNYIKAAGKGILKIMSKMGISTISSYTGAQVFEAVGLDKAFLDRYFTNTASHLGGATIDSIARDVETRHKLAFEAPKSELAHREVEVGGEYRWRREGELHVFDPKTVFKLQHSTRSKQYKIFKEYTDAVNQKSKQLATLRGLFDLRIKDKAIREPISIDEVEPASEIVKRFATGAMSYGSISKEAHENLAIAMNRLGGKSNTGEGGEDPERFFPDENGDLRRSAVKQVASGRFGVTSYYLINADDIQIKMAQGAKPGEGGQLPGHKVYPWIAKTRHSTPGVGLISPPPHHDIYSIEDLAQLIFDLKNANEKARIHVKLVSEIGVGTVAAGVAKAHADVVLISGHDGGTGAAPLTSIKHAGAPWELGLAETQQTLMKNGLRDRIVVQVDGQMKTGRDVIIAALLGAEEYGFATAALVVSGCIMMRVCHLDTCPVGIATQNPELRKRFTGKPEFVENFFMFIAEEVREYLAELGFKSLNEAIGQVESLDIIPAVSHYKASGIDLSPLLVVEKPEIGSLARYSTKGQDHGLDNIMDQELIKLAAPAIDHQQPVSIEKEVRNVNRSLGTMLGSVVTAKYGMDGLPEATIKIKLSGSAGQSLGAFLPRGIEIQLYGDSNDYLGKGLSGGRIILRPPLEATFEPSENIIAGNVCGYGATGGEIFISGVVGERFCVRNSGATAVVEGIGDHGCEYMTGGKVVILGKTGRNFAAGMSGGTAYILDIDGDFEQKLNREMVTIDEMNEEDISFLEDVCKKHFDFTDSKKALVVLDDFANLSKKFVKVMPLDYKRVSEIMKKAEQEGNDPIEAIMAASHG